MFYNGTQRTVYLVCFRNGHQTMVTVRPGVTATGIRQGTKYTVAEDLLDPSPFAEFRADPYKKICSPQASLELNGLTWTLIPV